MDPHDQTFCPFFHPVYLIVTTCSFIDTFFGVQVVFHWISIARQLLSRQKQSFSMDFTLQDIRSRF
jgi:hypothetical protein